VSANDSSQVTETVPTELESLSCDEKRASIEKLRAEARKSLLEADDIAKPLHRSLRFWTISVPGVLAVMVSVGMFLATRQLASYDERVKLAQKDTETATKEAATATTNLRVAEAQRDGLKEAVRQLELKVLGLENARDVQQVSHNAELTKVTTELEQQKTASSSLESQLTAAKSLVERQQQTFIAVLGELRLPSVESSEAKRAYQELHQRTQQMNGWVNSFQNPADPMAGLIVQFLAAGPTTELSQMSDEQLRKALAAAEGGIEKASRLIQQQLVNERVIPPLPKATSLPDPIAERETKVPAKREVAPQKRPANRNSPPNLAPYR